MTDVDQGGAAALIDRKRDHLTICADAEQYRVETASGGAHFAEIHLAHRALPELAASEIDPSVDFLGHRCALPFFISCITGGSERSLVVNRALATAAQSAGIAIGTGSFRAAIERPRFLSQFSIKRWAPDVPYIANISAVQLRNAGEDVMLDVAHRIEADALAVHLNVGQELFQPSGDRDFRDLFDAIRRLCDRSALPIIVKETGFGLAPTEVRHLLESGVAYVDVSGSGGTNWIAAEAYRLPQGPERAAARDFDEWGYPTALLLAALGDRSGRVIASGGIRSGTDVAKALALGAKMAGIALPFARTALERGSEGVLALVAEIEISLRATMILTSSRQISALDETRIWLEPSFAAEAKAIAALSC